MVNVTQCRRIVRSAIGGPSGACALLRVAARHARFMHANNREGAAFWGVLGKVTLHAMGRGPSARECVAAIQAVRERLLDYAATADRGLGVDELLALGAGAALCDMAATVLLDGRTARKPRASTAADRG